MKGQKILKVTSILMIIGGALSVILSIVAIIGIAAIAYIADGSVSLGMLYASGALMVVSSVAELVAGIVGTANSKKAEKAKHIYWPINEFYKKHGYEKYFTDTTDLNLKHKDYGLEKAEKN